MLDKSDFIAKLKEELMCYNEKFSKEDVYDQFEKFVNNKQSLRDAIEAGIFQYDYVKYETLFEGTLFEEGIQTIVELCRNGYKVNRERFTDILCNSYPQIARGLESQTQLCWLEGDAFDIPRNDLAVKKVFRVIGDLIENSFKPYALFVNELRALIQNKNANQKKLGMVVDALINYEGVFKTLYKELLLDISISQWRNIADHGSYENTEYGVVVIYGTNDEYKKIFSLQDLKILIYTLDTLLYMHKTAYSLVTIDYIDILKDVFSDSKRKEETWNDNLLSQIVETSFSYGFILNKIEKKSDIWFVEVETHVEQEQQLLTKYCSTIAQFLGECKLTIYRHNKVEYVVHYTQKRLEILKYKVSC